jgi:hypothetical protein
MRLTDHVTLNFNNNMSTAVVFLDIETTCDTRWHLGLLYKLSTLKCLISLIKLISSFLSQRRWKVYIKEHTGRGATSFHPVPTLYSIYINDMPQTPGVFLCLFADDTCTYATECKEDYVLRKLQRGLSAIETWCEHWNIKINEDEDSGHLFFSDFGPLMLILHRMDRISPSSIM